MRLGLLYSGGKDSSLAAYLLERLGFDVRLVTVTFGVTEGWRHARESAAALGFSHEVLRLGRDVLEEAGRLVVQQGYPRQAFDHIHRTALQRLASGYRVLSDGTRRDDRTPRIGLSDYRALESRDGVEYLPVLWGFGHRTINRLCSELFEIEEGESSKINKGDYEGELRAFLMERGLNVEKLFPMHTQTRVVSWRSKGCQRF
ncbi:MAG: hypothetical protein D6733_01425 [Methanobacteriota archaeon]|nr:MAG: hypothetical protein D6733_01425 [Euryarchaeota archaeon]